MKIGKRLVLCAALVSAATPGCSDQDWLSRWVFGTWTGTATAPTTTAPITVRLTAGRLADTIDPVDYYTVSGTATFAPCRADGSSVNVRGVYYVGGTDASGLVEGMWLELERCDDGNPLGLRGDITGSTLRGNLGSWGPGCGPASLCTRAVTDLFGSTCLYQCDGGSTSFTRM